ncbi:Hypothetical_protein [Hexamita inflata]|uniref:Hypothetical_protein n=1 Tax=Hexamita inflata TaxID=28002 RepID=A0AA86R5F7_9EUKA|nr:Hypothetical protein HINF_LOCUS12118 [Hexamita inflata]CAI9971821.1 Hypothetical protein HINF_LOCUS59466 [Hexamita inflata]
MNITKQLTDITLIDLSYKGCVEMCFLFGGTFTVILTIIQSLIMTSKMKKQYSTQKLRITTRIILCITTPLIQAALFTIWCPLHALIYWLLVEKSDLLKYLDKYYEDGKMSVPLYYTSIIIWSIGIPIIKMLIGINNTTH